MKYSQRAKREVPVYRIVWWAGRKILSTVPKISPDFPIYDDQNKRVGFIRRVLTD